MVFNPLRPGGNQCSYILKQTSVCVCVCVCVCVRPSINREGFTCLGSYNASEQINDFMLKTWISSTKSLLCYFRMKL